MYLCATLLLLAASAPAMAVQTLTLEDCLSAAETNHPDVRGADASVASQRGRLASSAVSDRLEVSGSAAATRNGSQIEEDTSYSLGTTASIKIYDSNRNKYAVDSARSTLSATEEEARKTLADIRANVKSSFLALSLDMQIANQRLESVRAFEQHLEQARGFYEAGAKPWYDVTKAEVDLGNAQLSLVEAESNIRTAKASLLNAMGVSQDTEFDISPSQLDILRIPDGAEETAESAALENRADYRASALRVQSGRSSLSAEARASSPTISLAGGYNAGGEDFFNLDLGWNAGLRLSVPIIDGGAAKARIDIARAQIDSLEASHEKLRQDILLDVRRALSDLTKARERLRLSKLTLVNAEENRRMAVGRYETGVGAPLEVTDALLTFTDAQLASRQAEYDLQIAIVGLEKAIGTDFLPSVPEE
jgi:outer membrane protein TolC